MFTNEHHNQNIRGNMFIAPRINRSVVQIYTGKTKFDGNKASIKLEDFNSIPEPYVNKDLSFPRIWIVVEDKLINAPVIIS